MPPLAGFSNSALDTRGQITDAAKAILAPLTAYTSPGCTRVRLPFTSGTLYDETAAQLEGFARPLWVSGSLLASNDCPDEILSRFITGLSNGTDPNASEYWGDIEDMDQRMVETEPIVYALLASPRHVLWEKLPSRTRSNIAAWFLQLNGKQMPRVNWLWFRVFTNLVLVKLCEIDSLEIRAQMEADLAELDTFYLKDGWSSDGKWRPSDADDEEWTLFQETGRVHSIKPDRCADYYSGSFAIQFSQLLYVTFAGDLDPSRTDRYKQQAREFGSQIWRYFDDQGAAIPFGRSMIYRFCCGAFFSALAVAKVSDMPKPLDSPGAIKGFLLRHLRWWSVRSSDIFHPDGTLNLGWLYPNMYLTEDYNSPQSVYWALKSFIAISLPENDPFWLEAENPYPNMDKTTPVLLLPAPRQILCNRSGSHHFLLSSAQFTSLYWKGAEAKYGKFAYSSAFGFSVPTGRSTLKQLAPDNMLVLSRDGTQTWAAKWKCREPTIGDCQVHTKDGCIEQLPFMTVVWYPWEDRGVTVTTIIIPPSRRWPDWHVRLHRVRVNDASLQTLHIAEGGFAINGQSKSNSPSLLSTSRETPVLDGAVVFSDAGTSGIAVNLTGISGRPITTDVSLLQPEANTNIMSPRTLIPLAEHRATRLQENDEITLCSSIFAVPTGTTRQPSSSASLRDRWLDRPVINMGDINAAKITQYIDASMAWLK